MTTLLIMPGLGDSGASHWQTFWLKKFGNAVKLNQDDWEEPDLNDWLQKLNDTLLSLNCPVILVAHSLAVSLVAHWAKLYVNANVTGAMLVAPADVDSVAHTPDTVRGFAPMPTVELPFPSIIVASDNDTFVSLERAKYFAAKWGGAFINIGAKGHINSSAALGFWEEGQNILQQLINMVKA